MTGASDSEAREFATAFRAFLQCVHTDAHGESRNEVVAPLTVSDLAERFAADENSHARVITPIHPGFNGTPRPDSLADIAGLAAL